jgi:hypothetical protein
MFYYILCEITLFIVIVAGLLSKLSNVNQVINTHNNGTMLLVALNDAFVILTPSLIIIFIASIIFSKQLIETFNYIFKNN